MCVFCILVNIPGFFITTVLRKSVQSSRGKSTTKISPVISSPHGPGIGEQGIDLRQDLVVIRLAVAEGRKKRGQDKSRELGGLERVKWLKFVGTPACRQTLLSIEMETRTFERCNLIMAQY